MNSTKTLLIPSILFINLLFDNPQFKIHRDTYDKYKPDTVKPVKEYGLKEYIYLSKDLPYSENKPWRLVCQMPYNCQFQPWIQLKSPSGKIISLNSSNPLVLYLTKTEMYTTKSGNQTYEAKNWVSGEGA